MSEPQTETTPQTGTEAQAATKPPTLEDLLSGLDDDAKKAVLGEVTKARGEAKNLRDRLKSAEPAVKRLAELEAQQVKTTEQWEAFAKQHEERADKAERELMVSRVALAKGLPADLASRLQGDDEAALSADADVLLSLVPTATGPRAPRPDASQGSSAHGRSATSPGDQFAAILQQQMGR